MLIVGVDVPLSFVRVALSVAVVTPEGEAVVGEGAEIRKYSMVTFPPVFVRDIV